MAHAQDSLVTCRISGTVIRDNSSMSDRVSFDIDLQYAEACRMMNNTESIKRLIRTYNPTVRLVESANIQVDI